MFSLIVTVIAVVLVTALALATVYYGASAFKQGRTAAEAARFINDGQQLTAATSMYAAKEGSYPATLQVLVDTGYLTSIPKSVALDNSPSFFVPTAYADEGSAWAMPVPNLPLYVYSTAPSEEVCREINRKVRGDNGILTQMVDGLAVQCYGSTNLTIVASLGSTGAVPGYAASRAEPVAAGVPSSPDDGLWRNPPSAGDTSSGGSSGGATQPPTDPAGFGSNPEVGAAPDPSTEFAAVDLGALSASEEMSVQWHSTYGSAGVALGMVNTGTEPITDPTFSLASNLAGKWSVDAAQATDNACSRLSSLAPGEQCQVNLNIGPMEPGVWTAEAVVSFTTKSGRRTARVPVQYTANVSSGAFWTTSQTISTGISSPLNYTAPSTAADSYLVEIYNNSPTKSLAFGSVSLASGAELSVSHNCGASLAPYGTCLVTVSWPDGTSGTHMADTLSIQMTDGYYGTTTKALPVWIQFP